VYADRPYLDGLMSDLVVQAKHRFDVSFQGVQWRVIKDDLDEVFIFAVATFLRYAPVA
jgi:hypothetical protein